MLLKTLLTISLAAAVCTAQRQGGQAAQQGGRQGFQQGGWQAGQQGSQGFQQGGRQAAQQGGQGGFQGMGMGGRPTPMNPSQFCNPPCTDGLQCQFKFNPATCKPGSHEGCFTCQAPRTRPTRPGGLTTVPSRTERPGMENCAKYSGGGDGMIVDQDTCEQWAICTSHRGTPAWIDAAGSDDAQCCCKVADGREFCCGVPDAPAPNKAKCASSDISTCSTPFFSAVDCAKALPTNIMQTCDPDAPKRSAAYRACFAYYNCVKKAYGDNFKKCCNCISFYASEFDHDLVIDCEDPGDGADDDM